MSDLENQVRPVATSFLYDLAKPLDEKDQSILATWALKIAMVLEGTRPAKAQHFYSFEERDHLRLKKVVQDTTHMWIGRSSERGLVSKGSDLKFRTSNGGEIKVLVTTLVVGHLALQIVSFDPLTLSRQQIPDIRIPIQGGSWERSLKRISPYERTVLWPPAISFGKKPSETSLEELHQRWRT